MKKNVRFLVITAVVAIAVQFAGCKKHDTKPPVEVCNITHTKFTFGTINEEGDFTYNSLGNPVTFTITQTGTGNPNVIFLYDQYHRLTDYFGPYAKLDPANLPAQITFEFWTRYTYADQNPNSLPVADTTRSFGFRTNGQFVSLGLVETGQYTFDSQGRITSFKSNANPNVSTYTYDSKGNASGPNVIVDDKVNFHRTSKIFQLVDKNYNANNTVVATTYNSNGLPTVFPLSTYPNSNAYFLHRQLNFATIDYACSIQSSAAE